VTETGLTLTAKSRSFCGIRTATCMAHTEVEEYDSELAGKATRGRLRCASTRVQVMDDVTFLGHR
jgi:hypothetical protein